MSITPDIIYLTLLLRFCFYRYIGDQEIRA